MQQPLYDTLLGNWKVNRVIDDRKGDQQGTFTGSAEFLGTTETLIYSETGKLWLAGSEMSAERRYLWNCEGQKAEVSYDDGRFFHSFTVIDGKATAEHLCGEDQYNAAYTFHSPLDWQVTWHVLGPRKDYTSVTTYKRDGTHLQ